MRTTLSRYLEVFNGATKLPTNYNTVAKELSFTNKYYHKGQDWLYILFLKKDTVDKNTAYTLVLALPLSKEEPEENENFIEKQKIKTKLRAFFQSKSFVIWKTFWLAKIHVTEDEYVNFCAFLEFEVVLNFSNNKVYSHSKDNLLEVTGDHTVLDEMKFGVAPYNTTLTFSNTFAFVGSKIVHVGNRENTTDWIVRKFFTNSVVVWAETITKERDIFLNRLPTFEFDKINYSTEDKQTDEFATCLGTHKITFSFGLDEKTEMGPKLQIKGGNPFDTATKLKQLSFAGMVVTRFFLNDSSVFHFVTPQFVCDEALDAEYLVYLVHYGVDDFKHGSKRVFYPLAESEVFLEIMLEHENPFFVTLKKSFENNCLLFRPEIHLDILKVEEFELPLHSDGSRPDLEYVYTTLFLPIEKVFNGALIKTQIEETDKPKPTTPKKTRNLFGKPKNIVLAVLVLVCLFVFFYISVCLKKTKFETKQKRFKKTPLNKF